MKSRIENHNYLILNEIDEKSYIINRKKLDKSLERIKKALDSLCSELKDAYKDNRGSNFDRYLFLKTELFELNRLDIDDDCCNILKMILNDIKIIQEQLASGNDDFLITTSESPITLSTLGYGHYILGLDAWEKKIEVSELKEVIEEIQLIDGSPVRRLRTTIYEDTDFGKSSTSITYKKLPIGKKLEKAIMNTFKVIVT